MSAQRDYGTHMRCPRFWFNAGGVLALAFALTPSASAWYLPPCLPTDVYIEEPRGKAHCLERRETKRMHSIEARDGVPATERAFTPEEAQREEENIRRVSRNPSSVRALRSFASGNHPDPTLRRHSVNFVSEENPLPHTPLRRDVSDRAELSHRSKRLEEKAKPPLH